jgi:hypothetical protein
VPHRLYRSDGGFDPARFDYFLRSGTSALLALIVVGVAAYQALANGITNSTFANWGGIIIGVYFGAHVTTTAATLTHRQDIDARVNGLTEEAE